MASFFDFRRQGAAKRRAKTAVSGNATRRKTLSRKKSKRKRTFKGKKSRKSSVKTLSRKVAKLSKGLAANTGTLVHRQLHVDSVSVPEGQSVFDGIILSSASRLIGALSAVPYYDSSTNNVVTADPTSRSYQNAYTFARTSYACTLINNATIGCTIRCGIMVPREDTNAGPVSAFLSGVADISISPTSPLVRLSDSQVLQDVWQWMPGSYKEVTLSPGGRYDLKASEGSFKYQLATVEADPLTYRKDDKPAVLVYQVMGVIASDSALKSEINFTECSLTVKALVVRTITYPAGAAIRRVVLSNTETSLFTNGGTVIQQPEAVQQTF